MTVNLVLWTPDWTGALALLFWLLVGHFLADYPLQGDFLAQAKNRHTPLGQLYWKHALTAHSAIQAGVVALITGSVALGLVEFVFHWYTDFLKCDRKLTLNQDQAVHLLCKLAYATIVVATPAGWLPGLWVVIPGAVLLLVFAMLVVLMAGPAMPEATKP